MKKGSGQPAQNGSRNLRKKPKIKTKKKQRHTTPDWAKAGFIM